MADFATYASMSGRKDWGQIRADRQNALLYQKQMNADLQERIQREAQSRQGVNEYMAQLNQASVLEGDLERVKGVEAEQRKKIVEGLKKAGGDYNKFLLGEGSGILSNYYQNVMQSKEMQNAINNKLTFAQGSLDTYMGRKQRPTEVTLQDGTKKQVSFEEQLQMFDNGEIDRLEYKGSVVPTDLVKIQQAIQQTFGKDPYTRKAATREDIYEYATRFGAEDWEANQLADSYEAGQIDGAETPIYFNYKERPKSNDGGMASYLKALQRKLEDNPYRIYDEAAKGVHAFSQSEVKKTGNNNSVVGKDRTFQYLSTPFANDQMRNDFANMAGIRTTGEGEDKRTYFTGTAYGANSLYPIDISAADIIDVQELDNVFFQDDVVKADKEGKVNYGNPVVKVRVRFDEDPKGDWWENYGLGADVFKKEKPTEESGEQGNFKRVKNQGSDRWQIEGDVFIPANMNELNKAMNNAPVSEFNDYNDMLQGLDAAIQYQYMQQNEEE